MSFQAGVGKFGFRPSKIKKTMVKQMQDCWTQLNPIPIKKLRKVKAKAVIAPPRPVQPEDGSHSEGWSSEDVPLAGTTGKVKRAKKAAKEVKEKVVPMTDEELYAEFRTLLVEPELYIRILRYEVSRPNERSPSVRN